ncbi:peptidylprolyl isomerase [Thermodesulfobacteriota bacterium]
MQMKKVIWVFVLFIAMGLVLVAMPAFAAEKQSGNSKVAVVNGIVITKGDLDREMIHVHQQLARRGKPFNKSQLPRIKKEVLETLINEELLYLESQSKGVKVEEKVVNERFDNLKKGFSSEDEFKSALLKGKISETALKSQMRKRMAIQQYVDKEFVQKVKVSEKEVKAYYASHPDMFKAPEQVRVRHILIKADPGTEKSKKSKARKKIEDVQKKLRKGGDFEALAKEYSEGPSNVKGGDIGYRSRGQLVKPFEEAAFSLPPGKVSDIVETQYGYHLIEVIDKKPESIVAYEQVKEKLQDYLKQKKVREKVTGQIEKLKGNAKVERFLGDNS